MSDRLDEVHELARATNGRLRKVELVQARWQGAIVAVGRAPVIVAMLAAVVTMLAGIASIVAVAVSLSR